MEALGELPSPCLRLITVRESASRTAAIADLDTLVTRCRATFIAWSLADGIETVRWIRGSEVGTPAFDAARVAAVAVLLRRELGERRFRALYAPYESVIPTAGSIASLRNLCAQDGSAKSTFERRLALST